MKQPIIHDTKIACSCPKADPDERERRIDLIIGMDPAHIRREDAEIQVDGIKDPDCPVHGKNGVAK